MGDSQPDGTLDSSTAVQVTGKIMVIAIIVVFLVVVMVLFLHLYAKWFWWRVEELPPRATARRRPRRRFIFAPGQEGAAAAGRLRRGLDPSILQSIPIVVFRPEEFKDGLECAVCLSELIDGEKARLLPKCNHGFHVGCIDMWFQSHSTCPLCRNSVASVEQEDDSSVELEFESLDRSLEEARAQEISSDGHPSSTEPLNLPTNVLFWGNEARMSSSVGSPDEGSVPNGEPSSASSSSSSTRPALQGALVIDIPSQAIESTSSASGCMQDELKSPVTPRLKSFKRLLSRERRVSPCSPPSVDAEQAERSLPC